MRSSDKAPMLEHQAAEQECQHLSFKIGALGTSKPGIVTGMPVLEPVGSSVGSQYWSQWGLVLQASIGGQYWNAGIGFAWNKRCKG